MLNRAELAACMARNGFTRTRLAKSIGMTPKTLYNKIKKGVFGSDEIERIVEVLHISDPVSIFFAQEVTSKDT